jgi:hypothetical protein
MRRLCSPCDLYALALWFPLELTLSHTRDRTWPGVSMVSSPPLAPFHLAVGFQQELKNSKWDFNTVLGMQQGIEKGP